MATIQKQQAARGKGKRLKPPTVKVHKSAMSDTNVIVEVTAPDGTSVLVSFGTNRDHSGLCMNPYRADRKVRLQVGSTHRASCDLQGPGDDKVCTCDCDLQYTDDFRWIACEFLHAIK